MPASTLDTAAGRWPEILCAIGGVKPEQLTDEHQPCPACGGDDRFRWDDDDGHGGWFCNQCGGKHRSGGGGTGVDLLMRVRDWDLKTALRHVDGYINGGSTPTPTNTRKPRRPARAPDVPPAGTPAPALGRAVAQFAYGPDAAAPWFYIQRIPQPPKSPGGKPGKLFIHRTWIDGAWHHPSRRDPFTTEWPAPRPVFNLPDLIARPDAPVLIVEGEGTAQSAATIAPDHVVLSGCGGTGGILSTDWSPLAGRTVTLWPDADAPGRQAMAKLAIHLLSLGAVVAVVAPSPDAPPGWDLADGVAAGWTPRHLAKAIRELSRPMELPPAPPAPPADPPPTPPQAPSGTAGPFTCLGFDKEGFYYLPRNTGQVVRLTRNGHTSTALCSLANSNTYWATLYQNARGSVDWPSAFSSLFAQQAAVGVFDPDRVRGRGAWIDDGRVVFHLGDRLIVDGKSHSVLSPPPTRYFYEQGCHLDGPCTNPLSDELSVEILNISERFKWEMDVSSKFLAGWLVLAPVCGALDWRPHIWITGGAGTGKTTVLSAFLRPLLGGVLMRATGGSTEAGLRGTLHSDAIPIVFDEFEQNEARDKTVVQNVLQLARCASSDGGKILKGMATGGAIGYEIRSMFCVSSINVALIQKADVDRFCVLGLRRDPMSKDDWRHFEAEISTIASSANGKALIARTLRYLPQITQNAKTIGTALAKRFGQRFGDQHGTLLAGAWSLESNGGGLLTPETADAWIDSMNWDHHQSEPAESDEMKCRDAILQQIVRLDGGSEASLGEIARAVLLRQSIDKQTYSDLGPVLGRHGLKVIRMGETVPGVDDAVAPVHYLAVANTSKQLEAVLRPTPWGNGAFKAALRRIDGAVIPVKGTHFSGVGTHRFVLVPVQPEDLAS
jgi:putative DNA primase/helicase